jgi:hypothetical protein
MTRPGLLGSRRARRLLLLLALVAVLALLLLRGPAAFRGRFGLVGSHDFLEYWGAARLLWHGGNPYDPVALLAVEQGVGWPESRALMMYNPPWTLTLLLPLAPLPFGLATITWLLVQLGLLLGCSLLLWRYFAPDDRRYWIGPLLAAAFAPSVFALRMGQISPWLLLGVVGFLWCQRGRRDLLAGASLALLTIKPHVAYLFWLAALWWAWRSRRWRVLAGWLAALIAASGVVLLFSPAIFANYLVVVAGPQDWASPTFGGWLRFFFGLERTWLQYLPSLLGLLGLAIWLWRRRGPWHWREVASPLLLASGLAAAYGWSFDQVVLLPVLVDLVARLRWASVSRRVAVLAALVLSQAGLWILNQYSVNEIFYVWHVPVFAAIYWLGVRYTPRPGGDRAYGGVM